MLEYDSNSGISMDTHIQVHPTHIQKHATHRKWKEKRLILVLQYFRLLPVGSLNGPSGFILVSVEHDFNGKQKVQRQAKDETSSQHLN